MSTDPPSAGGHYPLWAVWGFYRSPVNPRQVVHNEEHGAVVIWWGPKVPKATVDKLQAFYQQQPDAMFGTPYPSLGNKIALTAWTGDPSKYYLDGNYGMGHIAICSSFDQDAFAAFRSAYRGKGPEGIPHEPGMGPLAGSGRRRGGSRARLRRGQPSCWGTRRGSPSPCAGRRSGRMT